MIRSQGGVHGGMTIADALREFEARGYVGQFLVRDGALVECRQCGTVHRPPDVRLEGMRRIEGVSDPADMVFVGALVCPECGERGTATLQYGPMASPEDSEVLRELDNQRTAATLTQKSSGDDSSLVSDSGWLRGPDG